MVESEHALLESFTRLNQIRSISYPSDSLYEHGLRCAHLASERGNDDEFVLAALLHDIGHALFSGDELLDGDEIDAEHALIGERYLSRFFASDSIVPKLVGLHIDAKRYQSRLANLARPSPLSLGSQRSLELQSGAMSSAEAASFEVEPLHELALRLRDIDDTADGAVKRYAPLEDYISTIRRVMR